MDVFGAVAQGGTIFCVGVSSEPQKSTNSDQAPIFPVVELMEDEAAMVTEVTEVTGFGETFKYL